MHATHASNRPVLSSRGLALCLALAACSARGTGGTTTGDGGTVTGNDSGTTQPPALSFTCAQFCASLASEPSCGAAGVATCMSTCDTSISATPPACAASANALYACTRTAAPRCTAPGAFPFAGCQTQYGAFVSCVTSSPTDAGVVTPPVDSGTSGDGCSDALSCSTCTGRASCGWCANRCWRGSSSGPGAGSCAGTPWAWTSNMCSATPPVDAGGGTSIPAACQSCAFSMCSSLASACSSEPACLQCIASPNESCLSNSRFLAVAECACGACNETCGPFCEMFE